MHRTFLTSIAVLVILTLSIAWNSPNEVEEKWRNKVSSEVLSLVDRGSKADIIILLEKQVDVSDARGSKESRASYVFEKLKEIAETSQKSIISFLNNEDVNYQPFFVVNAIQMLASPQQVMRLAQFSEVAEIQFNPTYKLNHVVEKHYTNSRNPQNIEWGIEMINADDVWELGYTGQEVVVGGADTGYEWTHPALKNKYRGWNGGEANHNYSWFDAISEISPLHNDEVVDPSNNPCGLKSSEPCDDHDHGTHTMGTMVGEDGDNQIGVAPGAKWIACRNMERGYGSPASYIACFEWFLAPTDTLGLNPDPSMAPHVINNSWACPEMEGCTPSNWSTMEMAVENLRSSGVVVVVSAGNSGAQGCGTINAPAAMFKNSFTVGSTSANDSISNFSSRGSVNIDSSGRIKPNVSAPGRQVRSSVRNGGYASFSGTSMAGPHVVGLVALVISANPSLAGQVEKIEDIVELSSVAKTSDQDCGDILGEIIPNNIYGFGRVDALAAVEMALQSTSSTDDVADYLLVHSFPNPVSDNLTITIEGASGPAKIDIYALDGRKVLSHSFVVQTNSHSENLSISSIPAGLFIQQIQIGKKTVSKRFVKN